MRISSCAFVAVCLLAELWSTNAAARQPLNVRVVWRESPATEAIIAWDTTDEAGPHTLSVAKEGSDDWKAIECENNGRYDDSKKAPYYFHHAKVTGLKPSTRYRIRATSDGQSSQSWWFLTAPDDGSDFQLLFGGDSRSGHDQRQKMNRLMARLVVEARKAGRPPVLALAHGGDYVVSGLRWDLWRRVMDDWNQTTTDDGQLLPIIPARGNHDVGELYNQVFGFPPAHENYYVTQLSGEAALVTLNTNISTAGDQQAWLAEQLSVLRPINRWLICQYHRPAFPAVKVPGGAFVSWTPLFEKYNIDLACEADGHCLKRTAPIRNKKIDPTGVVYIGEGGLGVGQRSPKTDRWFLKPPGMATKGHHIHLLHFAEDKLSVRVIGEEGDTIDEFIREPRQPNLAASASSSR